VTQQQLVRRVGSDPNTVRAMLLLLEGRGLVARGRHAADGRARCVTLTVEGRQVFKKLWKKSEPLRARLLAAFRPDEVTALLEFLRRVAEVMVLRANNGSRTIKTKSSPVGLQIGCLRFLTQSTKFCMWLVGRPSYTFGSTLIGSARILALLARSVPRLTKIVPFSPKMSTPFSSGPTGRFGALPPLSTRLLASEPPPLPRALPRSWLRSTLSGRADQGNPLDW
jgi:hypothetical protein